MKKKLVYLFKNLMVCITLTERKMELCESTRDYVSESSKNGEKQGENKNA